ncbi:hypothetical protein P691DRAFT_711677 [Macrolepiota fuliginosa MF-IS2]|uniref:F-box domain-containing protein n=1 Tax=Macrolepiota fuliginosa MF-IS2 TaxID=1400762 RepID=A0A9P6C0F5_9AGAR|nr:hypothetical protein P691DRAFT_711677 [Macrolepiota fuliginosa MF-IS2]
MAEIWVAETHVTCPTCGHQEITKDCAILNHFTINPVLVHSNCVPSSSQTQDIRKSIAHAKLELQSLETEIQRVRGALAGLERRQEAVKSYVTCQENLLSPIRCVPPEILGQIFLALRDMSEPTCFGDDTLENVELWTLLRVCRLWRDVAVSYSDLWPRFVVARQPFGRPSERDTDVMLRQSLRLTKDCIAYSRTKPLFFVFHANQDLLEVGKLLAAECPRWSSVAFNNLPVLQALEPEIHGRLPNLRALLFDGLGKEWNFESQPVQAFSIAPSLTQLTLNVFEMPQDRFILPWHQITHFTSFELRQFLPILHLMPSLIDFTSTMDICQPSEIQDRIPLLNLERLEVTSNSPTMSQVFDSLGTPKLSSLHLLSKRGFSRIYSAAVVQMIRWSGCTLKVLSVTDYAVDSILHILREVRDLEELTVTNLTYPSELLDGMGGMLPHLQTLTLRKCEPDLRLSEHLVRMVQARIETRGDRYGRQSIVKINVAPSSTLQPSFFQNWNVGAQKLEDVDVQVELKLV